MRILMLGATGYLGGNIVKRLVEDGHKVICVTRPTSDCSRLCLGSGRIEIISNDLGEIEETLQSKDVDWVVNGVCTYNPNASLYGDMLDSNLMFPLSVLNLAIKYDVKNYMTMGTGLPGNFNVYSFTKHEFAVFGKFLSEKDHVNFVNLELEMFYGGTYEPLSRFMNACLTKLKANDPLELTSGIQSRDIVRVEDVVDIISWIIKEKPFTGYKDLPIGSGESHSIREMVTFMKDNLGSASILNFGAIESREGEPNTLADISWMRKYNRRLKYSYWSGLIDYLRG